VTEAITVTYCRRIVDRQAHERGDRFAIGSV
jgi:hypothetical protein